MDDRYLSEPCPVANALSLISGKWKILILYRLSISDTRYNELKRQVFGITNTALTRGLNELQQDGLVKRTDYEENPPCVVYALTEYGKTLLPILQAIHNWADEYMGIEILK